MVLSDAFNICEILDIYIMPIVWIGMKTEPSRPRIMTTQVLEAYRLDRYENLITLRIIIVYLF